MKPIRVLVGDDHPLIIEGLTTVLARFDIEVVGHASAANEVLAQYLTCTPDVIVLDIRFGNAAPSGLDVAREALQRYPDARILVYSQFDQTEMVREAYRIGCVGFVPKSNTLEVLAEAIKQVHRGKMYFLPEIAERLAMIGVKGDDSPQAKLDARELEVFRLIAQGRTNLEIAEAMGLSPKTISLTSQLVKDKLGVQRAAEITRLAVRHGVIEP